MHQENIAGNESDMRLSMAIQKSAQQPDLMKVRVVQPSLRVGSILSRESPRKAINERWPGR